MGGDGRAAGQRGGQVLIPSTDVFCACIVCSLVLQRNPGQDKRVSPHILSVAPEGAFISKGNCRKRVTQYHSLLARTEC